MNYKSNNTDIVQMTTDYRGLSDEHLLWLACFFDGVRSAIEEKLEDQPRLAMSGDSDLEWLFDEESDRIGSIGWYRSSYSLDARIDRYKRIITRASRYELKINLKQVVRYLLLLRNYMQRGAGVGVESETLL